MLTPTQLREHGRKSHVTGRPLRKRDGQVREIVVASWSAIQKR
ncbi:hypothetical protein [Streptomyces bungoensis]|nr:hypothetical protein [Streptomyces bungoensis]